jgi:hypothetical protein
MGDWRVKSGYAKPVQSHIPMVGFKRTRYCVGCSRDRDPGEFVKGRPTCESCRKKGARRV